MVEETSAESPAVGEQIENGEETSLAEVTPQLEKTIAALAPEVAMVIAGLQEAGDLTQETVQEVNDCGTDTEKAAKILAIYSVREQGNKNTITNLLRKYELNELAEIIETFLNEKAKENIAEKEEAEEPVQEKPSTGT